MVLKKDLTITVEDKEKYEKAADPVFTYNDDGRSLYGTPPDAAVVTLQSLGADAVGLNCSTGPSDMVPLVEKMRRVSRVPIIAKPNAGLPELINGESVYQMGPEDFAAEMELPAANIP